MLRGWMEYNLSFLNSSDAIRLRYHRPEFNRVWRPKVTLRIPSSRASHLIGRTKDYVRTSFMSNLTALMAGWSTYPGRRGVSCLELSDLQIHYTTVLWLKRIMVSGEQLFVDQKYMNGLSMSTLWKRVYCFLKISMDILEIYLLLDNILNFGYSLYIIIAGVL